MYFQISVAICGSKNKVKKKEKQRKFVNEGKQVAIQSIMSCRMDIGWTIALKNEKLFTKKQICH